MLTLNLKLPGFIFSENENNQLTWTNEVNADGESQEFWFCPQMWIKAYTFIFTFSIKRRN